MARYRYCMNSAYEAGVKTIHPVSDFSRWAKPANVTSGQGFTIADCWIFTTDVEIPHELPDYIEQLP